MSPREIWHLPHRHIGCHVAVYATLDSTNRLAAELLSGAHDQWQGWAVVAEEQTAGRGQHGRLWLTPPGTALLLSVLLEPPPSLRRPVLLTAWAAVAVADAITKLTGLHAQIKWPNDLLVHKRKVCGILLECHGPAAIAGIGLNLSQRSEDWQVLGLPHAVSLLQAAGTAPTIRRAAECVLSQLDELYDGLLAGQLEPLREKWQCRLGLLDRWVRAELSDGSWCSGRLAELRFDAVTLTTSGRCYVWPPERIRHLELTEDA